MIWRIVTVTLSSASVYMITDFKQIGGVSIHSKTQSPTTPISKFQKLQHITGFH